MCTLEAGTGCWPSLSVSSKWCSPSPSGPACRGWRAYTEMQGPAAGRDSPSPLSPPPRGYTASDTPGSGLLAEWRHRSQRAHEEPARQLRVDGAPARIPHEQSEAPAQATCLLESPPGTTWISSTKEVASREWQQHFAALDWLGRCRGAAWGERMIGLLPPLVCRPETCTHQRLRSEERLLLGFPAPAPCEVY